MSLQHVVPNLDILVGKLTIYLYSRRYAPNSDCKKLKCTVKTLLF